MKIPPCSSPSPNAESQMTTDKKHKILTAYTGLLNQHGLKGSSLDALAQLVGLSKAGLLHHFRSRAALDAALIQRLRELIRQDLELMSADLSSAVSYYFTSSMDYGSELEQLVVAVSRLGRAGNSEATETLRWARDSWYEVMLEALGDPTLAKLALLAGDGISYHLGITVDKDDGFVTEETLTAMVKAIHPAG